MENYTEKEVDANGNVHYYNNIELYHRLDGPAIEWCDGGKEWYINGELHKKKGPAVCTQELKQWWLYGKLYPKHCHNKLTLFSILEPLEMFII